MLHQLASAHLPHVVDRPEDVDAVQVLVMAGHVKAEISPLIRDIDGSRPRAASVLEITSLGRRMLRTFRLRAG